MLQIFHRISPSSENFHLQASKYNSANNVKNNGLSYLPEKNLAKKTGNGIGGSKLAKKNEYYGHNIR